jgi:uncharacterized membrane protein
VERLNDPKPAPAPVISNIEFVRQAEQRMRAQRPLGVRVSDFITRGLGSMPCVLLHVVFFSSWFAVNSGALPIEPFDPFPFGILTLIVSAEGVLLAIFVLISQNRMLQEADRRAHLDLQVNLLTEQSSTKILQMITAMAERMSVPEAGDDSSAVQLSQPTNLETLISEVDRSLGKE